MMKKLQNYKKILIKINQLIMFGFLLFSSMFLLSGCSTKCEPKIVYKTQEVEKPIYIDKTKVQSKIVYNIVEVPSVQVKEVDGCICNQEIQKLATAIKKLRQNERALLKVINDYNNGLEH